MTTTDIAVVVRKRAGNGLFDCSDSAFRHCFCDAHDRSWLLAESALEFLVEPEKFRFLEAPSNSEVFGIVADAEFEDRAIIVAMAFLEVNFQAGAGQGFEPEDFSKQLMLENEGKEEEDGEQRRGRAAFDRCYSKQDGEEHDARNDAEHQAKDNEETGPALSLDGEDEVAIGEFFLEQSFPLSWLDGA
jgi:hypothetical protein